MFEWFLSLVAGHSLPYLVEQSRYRSRSSDQRDGEIALIRSQNSATGSFLRRARYFHRLSFILLVIRTHPVDSSHPAGHGSVLRSSARLPHSALLPSLRERRVVRNSDGTVRASRNTPEENSGRSSVRLLDIEHRTQVCTKNYRCNDTRLTKQTLPCHTVSFV